MADNKMYQVFVSSTYEDLKEERNRVLEALLSINCIPIGMEYFSASDDDQFTVIKNLMATCDYYVLILGGRYGSIEENSGKSYTQLEYEFAKSNGIPTIAFYPKDILALTGNKLEQDLEKKNKLEEFTKVVKQQLCMAYTNADNLALNVIKSLTNLISHCPRIGWVRGDSVSSNEANQRILQLQKENESLKNEIKSYKADSEEKIKSYQQGEDQFEIVIKPKYSDNPFGLELSEKTIVKHMSWNDIFKLIGPSFISPVQTNMSYDVISDIICTSEDCISTYLLDLQCANTIMTQLYALGYFDLQTGEVFQNGVMSYYVLSKYGIQKLVELKVIKKENE